MCQHLVSQSDEQLLKTAYSDEARFYLSASVNTKNTVRYAHRKVKGGSGRPSTAICEKKSYPESVMVFLGIFDGKTFGFRIFEETMNSELYQEHVTNICTPEIRHRNGGSLIGVTWQQDGASCHRNPGFMRFLDEEYNGCVLALGADRPPLRGVEWSPRSPDLNPLDYSVWSILKDRVYKPRPSNLQELKDKIREEVSNLSEDLLRRIVLNLRSRAELYIANNGGHFEPDL